MSGTQPIKRAKAKPRQQKNATLAIRIEAVDWKRTTSSTQKAVAEEFSKRYPHLELHQREKF